MKEIQLNTPTVQIQMLTEQNLKMIMEQNTANQAKNRIQFGGKSSMLDWKIAITLVKFQPTIFRKLLCLSPNWHYLVLEGMDNIFKPVECGFINQYFEHLMFKRSYTNSSVIYSGGRKGIRLDRVLVCEVLENQRHLNKCLNASFAYKLHKQGRPEIFGPGKARMDRE